MANPASGAFLGLTLGGLGLTWEQVLQRWASLTCMAALACELLSGRFPQAEDCSARSGVWTQLWTSVIKWNSEMISSDSMHLDFVWPVTAELQCLFIWQYFCHEDSSYWADSSCGWTVKASQACFYTIKSCLQFVKWCFVSHFDGDSCLSLTRALASDSLKEEFLTYEMGNLSVIGCILFPSASRKCLLCNSFISGKGRGIKINLPHVVAGDLLIFVRNFLGGKMWCDVLICQLSPCLQMLCPCSALP